MGLHKAADYYCYPGFHEPSSGSAVGINRGVWESFDASDRKVIEADMYAPWRNSMPTTRCRYTSCATKALGLSPPFRSLNLSP
jgi:TRAP-type mannitol/chloroaromatic compound transport system substrate-binding protein